jgi:hypothetical protein
VFDIQKGFSMIDEDEIISTSAHLHKRNLHGISPSLRLNQLKCLE